MTTIVMTTTTTCLCLLSLYVVLPFPRYSYVRPFRSTTSMLVMSRSHDYWYCPDWLITLSSDLDEDSSTEKCWSMRCTTPLKICITFHNKSHSMKALVILSHSWSPFLPLTCLIEKMNVGVHLAFWSIIVRKKLPSCRLPMHITMI